MNKQNYHPGQELNNHGQEFIPPQYHGTEVVQAQPLYETSANQNVLSFHNTPPEKRGFTGITSCEQLWRMPCCFEGHPTWKFWIFLAYFLAFAATIGIIIAIVLTAIYSTYPSSVYPYGSRPTYSPYNPTSTYRPTPTYGSTIIVGSRTVTFAGVTRTYVSYGLPTSTTTGYRGIPAYTTGYNTIAVASGSIPSAICSISSILGLVIMNVILIITTIFTILM